MDLARIAQEQESGEASGLDDAAPGISSAVARRPSSLSRHSSIATPRQPLDARAPSRDLDGKTVAEQHENSARDGQHGKGAEQPPLREEREKEQLSSSLRDLTRYTSVQDAMKALDTICKDLKSAIKKLDKLVRLVRVSQHRSAGCGSQGPMDQVRIGC